MSKKEIEKLRLSIEQIKSRMLRIERYLKEHEAEEPTEFFIKQLESRKDVLEKSFQRHQDVYLQLVYLSPDDVDNSDEFENM